MKVILSVEEFLKALKVGDVFWHMTSLNCRPYSIEGPVRIRKLEQYDQSWLVYLGGKPRFDQESVSDLTNHLHGAFLSEEDAQEYFQKRKVAYATDPELIFEAARFELEAARLELGSESEELWRLVNEPLTYSTLIH